MESDARPYEILEHTADIGLRAWGDTREKLFENCALGLAEILDRDAGPPRAGEAQAFTGLLLEVEADDIEALLVEWMNEVMFLIETTHACLRSTRVSELSDTRLRAEPELAECDHKPEGTELKAATYHQVSVRQVSGQWEATIYFDV
jgi:SHS2 domain-containing protein